jgi:hypothetical protein
MLSKSNISIRPHIYSIHLPCFADNSESEGLKAESKVSTLFYAQTYIIVLPGIDM